MWFCALVAHKIVEFDSRHALIYARYSFSSNNGRIHMFYIEAIAEFRDPSCDFLYSRQLS
jgi:hypothetical protein